MRLIIKKIILKLNKILQKHNLRVIVQDIKKPIILDDLTKNEIRRVKKILNLTMVSSSNLTFLLSAINYIKKNKIRGDYAETGVWRGGVSILSYLTFSEKFKIKKNFYLYDTFEGMPEPSKHDKKINKNLSQVLDKWKKTSNTKEGWNFSPIVDVKKNISKFCGKKSLKKFKFIKGKVENTLKIKKNLPKRICLLRLDTDFYNSTKTELNYLFNRVSKGGVIIFDDYSNWLGAKKAIDDFFKNKKYLLCKIDDNSRFIIK